MINIKDKKKCCGCSACLSICPKKAISFEMDEEGFRYPIVNKKKCIKCNLCEKVCPFLNNTCEDEKKDLSNEKIISKKILELKDTIGCYVCYNNDYKARNESTSGGFFSVISNYIILKGGYVCGVTYDNNFNICHKMVKKQEDIKQFRGSKYVQSNQDKIYEKIKEKLDKNEMVLYSGTPCQVEGLLNYLQKPYDNLVTVDLVCHGVGSELYWEKYKKYMECKYKSKIKSIYFREKTYGYNSSCMAVYFENGKKSRKGHNHDNYLLPFFKDYILRPSCYNCKVKKIKRKSDFTMGDYWNCDKLPDKFKKANGCTLLLCNTNKSFDIFNDIKEELSFEKISLKEGLIVNSGNNYSMVLKSTNKPNDRNEFMNDLEKTDYKNLSKLLKKYITLTKKDKIAIVLKPILYKMRLLEIAKKITKKSKKTEKC